MARPVNEYAPLAGVVTDEPTWRSVPESKVPLALVSRNSATLAPAIPVPPSLAVPSPLASLSTLPEIAAAAEAVTP